MVALVGLGITAAGSATASAQGRRTPGTTRGSGDQQVSLLLRRLELHTDAFRTSLDAALDASRIDGARREDNINELTRDFENAVDQLRGRFTRRQAGAADVQFLLERAEFINNFLTRNRLNARVQQDWTLVRADLNQLSRIYGVQARAGNQPNTSSSRDTNGQGTLGVEPRLTGTFQLDQTRSQNPNYIADRITRDLPASERQRIYNAVLTRVEPPDTLAIDRRGQQVTIASSRAPQVTFDSDGRERVEQTFDGRTVRTIATLSNSNLVINSTGDRANDFTVTFQPLDNGNRLSVTRRVFVEGINDPVIVESFYNRTSSVAQLNIYNQPQQPTYTGTNPRDPQTSGPVVNTTSDGFIVRDGTTLVAVLNDTLSTQQSRDGDRFTLTVRDPSQFEGATIEGYVSNVGRAGRITGRSTMSLNFERIRLRDGRSSKFAGFIDSVRATNGETVRVDNEGGV